MEVRLGRKEDVQGVVEVIKDAWTSYYCAADGYWMGGETLEKMIKCSVDYLEGKDPYIPEIPKYYVAEENGETVGFMFLNTNFYERFWIWDLMVKKAWQGKGVGKKLFETAAKDGKEIYINVNPENPAMAFWDKLGFKTIRKSVVMKWEK